jgi:hypothetical protein
MASQVLLAWANTLAYATTELKTAVICFMIQSLGTNVLNIFTAVVYECSK